MTNPNDFTEMAKGFDISWAIAEANRCLLCHDAPCSEGCPGGTDPATFIRKLRLRDITGAIRTIKENNILGGACGVLCPSARLCEEECSATGLDRPIEIGKIQRTLVEYSWEIGVDIFKRPKQRGEKVAVVGAGPAGLSCAAELAKAGYGVTVFEEKAEAGGVLRYGVPSYRFSKEFLERELEGLKTLGVEFKFSTPIKGDGAAQKLIDQGYKAVFLAPGVWQPIRLKETSGQTEGLFTCTDFLEALRDNKTSEVAPYIEGKKVAVIGGGSVAIDCTESAIRLGASDVYLVYRRAYAQMPAEEDELLAALRAGVQFLLLNQPTDYVTDGNGRLTGLKVVRTRLGEKDSSGRRCPVEISSSEWTLEVDAVIEAIGSVAAADSPSWYPEVKVSEKKLIVTDPETGKTSVEGIFAGGDIARGPALVINAIDDGKKAARAIAQQLSPSPQPSPRRGEGVDLSVDFCGVTFLNPFMLSSSPASNCAEMVGRAFDAGWSGVAFKTIVTGATPIIHPSPRMHGYDYGNKKLVGLQNVEQVSDRTLKDNLLDLMYLKKHWPKHIIMASIMGFSTDEWTHLAKACTDAGADMLELNFSCPHMTVEGAGHKVGQAFELIQRFTEAVRKATKIPIVAKMTPNITDMNEPAMFAKKGGADAISAINTIRGISEVGLDNWIPRPNVGGMGAISGYSGPAVKPVGLRFIAEMAQNKDLGLPLSGMGGIETWIDTLEYILVGATTVQVTTGIIHYGYPIVEDMIEGLSDYMANKKIGKVADLIGRALPQLHDTNDFDLKKQGRVEYDLDRCVGCGQCYIVCRDAGGQALEWDGEKRRPKLTEDKCLGCMICSFICPVSGLITYKAMPPDWKRQEAPTLGRELESELKL